MACERLTIEPPAMAVAAQLGEWGSRITRLATLRQTREHVRGQMAPPR